INLLALSLRDGVFRCATATRFGEDMNFFCFAAFWKIVLEGPPDTPYEKGTFELYCQFGTEYPVKPPTVRFVTPIYHCNINNVGRICHNILDRNYNSLITMREILEAVFGLLMHPEPEDPLDREHYSYIDREGTQKS
uniref:UBC core domain-containing protein n=1 Tax=Xiphophorus couchianus TaxID=32473 RepID=A0A3B5KWC9_9TELE